MNPCSLFCASSVCGFIKGPFALPFALSHSYPSTLLLVPPSYCSFPPFPLSSSLVHKINITIFALSTSFASCPALPYPALRYPALPYPTVPRLGLVALPGSVIRVKLFQKAYFKMKIFLRLSAKTNVWPVPGTVEELPGGCSTGCCTGCLQAVGVGVTGFS